MMSNSAKKVVMLNLYKKLLRESQKFSSYNYRLYALRKVKHEFKSNSKETDSTRLDALEKRAKDNLEMLQRQVVIGDFYKGSPLVIERNHTAKTP